ncbi:hypothetical protein [Lyngbya aestuarii]
MSTRLLIDPGEGIALEEQPYQNGKVMLPARELDNPKALEKSW